MDIKSALLVFVLFVSSLFSMPIPSKCTDAGRDYKYYAGGISSNESEITNDYEDIILPLDLTSVSIGILLLQDDNESNDDLGSIFLYIIPMITVIVLVIMS